MIAGGFPTYTYKLQIVQELKFGFIFYVILIALFIMQVENPDTEIYHWIGYCRSLINKWHKTHDL